MSRPDWKQGDQLKVAFTCPCPNYRGAVITFDKFHPASEECIFGIDFDDECLVFRIKDCTLIPKAKKT